ncbi:MAG: selenocysteine-specific translation elongation factor [Betaproteobacteria bacterium]|nr:selenocysteine-specific translation elongation factor [Betaproteobacteria bacterium]
MIIATAGHIDHGKTLLVKTLTGVDTDRLPEEKARGISIDLGFAYWPLESGTVIGFVDVPGHERFIRNMLAGVCGIDFALLVVAADDGVMPQTVEHLHILDLLGLTRGVAVITKTDRVAPERVEAARAEVAALLAPTRLAGIPVLAVSAVTGAGIDELRQRLVAAAGEFAARAAEGQHFRFAIDRAFTIAGSGTVVTGTVFNGAVATSDRLVVSPKGTPVRVRGIQMRGLAAERAQAGQRCALNLSGTDLETVARGDWLLHEAIHAPTQRIDARVTVLASEKEPLDHWTPLHVHLATADVTGRVSIPQAGTIPPGGSAIVQLALAKPVGALHGDRFILRDQSARRTLGGGVVLDPFARAARRASGARLAELAALERDSPDATLAALLDNEGRGVDLARFERMFNLNPERASALYAAAGIAVLGREARLGVKRAYRDGLRERAVAAVRDFHRAQPQATGMDPAALRKQLAPQLPAEAFQSLLRELADERKLEITSNVLRVPGHDATSNPEDQRLWQLVLPALQNAGLTPPPVAELAAALKLKEATLKDFLHRKARGGEIMRVPPDRFYPRATLATLAATAQALARSSPNGFTAAQFRDATGIGRSLAIEILEFLDTLSITQRIGDARKMRKDFVPILGPAEPARAPAKAAAPTPAAAAKPRPSSSPYRR